MRNITFLFEEKIFHKVKIYHNININDALKHAKIRAGKVAHCSEVYFSCTKIEIILQIPVKQKDK